MKKKIILSIMLVLIGGGTCYLLLSNNEKRIEQTVKDNQNNKFINNELVETVKEVDENSIPSSPTVNEETSKISIEKEDVVSNSELEVPNLEVPKKTNTTSTSNSTQSQTKTSSKEEVKNEDQKIESNKNTSTEIEIKNVSTTFYDSITHGKKEFSTEEEALARGYEIQNKEYDYVFDYNDQHPESPIEVDINYFRVYPSVIDENGKTWYYLHFFCKSGESNDEKLKSKF